MRRSGAGAAVGVSACIAILTGCDGGGSAPNPTNASSSVRI